MTQRFWIIRHRLSDCLYYNGENARKRWTLDIMAARRFPSEDAALAHIVGGKISAPAHAVEVFAPPDA